MRRQILIGDDPRLRTKAGEVSLVRLATNDTQDLIDDLLDMTERMDGLGMAAPQVGESVRIIAVLVKGKTQALVNPRIVARSKELRSGEEGCFSFPGLFGKVTRHRTIDMEALDRRGSSTTLHLEGLDARVVQHELDHLDGILLPDRLAEKSVAPAEVVSASGRTL
jgi:peptide deformylase